MCGTAFRLAHGLTVNLTHDPERAFLIVGFPVCENVEEFLFGASSCLAHLADLRFSMHTTWCWALKLR
jgi:hypothetical protein